MGCRLSGVGLVSGIGYRIGTGCGRRARVTALLSAIGFASGLRPGCRLTAVSSDDGLSSDHGLSSATGFAFG